MVPETKMNHRKRSLWSRNRVVVKAWLMDSRREGVGRKLRIFSPEVIVENGGDIFLNTVR